MALVDDFLTRDGVPAASLDAVHQLPVRSAPGPYVLATGPAADYRLRLLHGLYGPGTRRLLRGAGLRRGMRVADVGSAGRACGAACASPTSAAASAW
jgi:hypothetical protein